jgi:hypothetical protein
MFVCCYLFTKIITALPNGIKLRPSAKRSSYISVVVVEHFNNYSDTQLKQVRDETFIKKGTKSRKLPEEISLSIQAANRPFHAWVAKTTQDRYKLLKNNDGKFGHREFHAAKFQKYSCEKILKKKKRKISRSLCIDVGQSFVLYFGCFFNRFVSIAIIQTTIIRLHFTVIGYEDGRKKKGGQGVEPRV